MGLKGIICKIIEICTCVNVCLCQLYFQINFSTSPFRVFLYLSCHIIKKKLLNLYILTLNAYLWLFSWNISVKFKYFISNSLICSWPFGKKYRFLHLRFREYKTYCSVDLSIKKKIINWNFLSHSLTRKFVCICQVWH